MTTTRDLGLSVAQKAANRWYVIGHMGGRRWMPISGPYGTKREADARRVHLGRAEAEAKRELLATGV